jgi:hypothetical protein
MKSQSVSLAENLGELAGRFAQDLKSMAGDDPNIRNAVLKSGLRDVLWELVSEFPDDKYEISEFLELMSGLVREHES